MTRFKGIIALDIDGTITVDHASINEKIICYLNQLIDEGWRLIFITGRTFSFAKPILASIQGDYFFASQNGAALYEMPHELCVKRHFLSIAILNQLAPFFRAQNCGLLVESGKENGDICYYNPSDFNAEELTYLAFRMQISPETWIPIDSFDQLPVKEFAVGKYFASEKSAQELAENILNVHRLGIIVIRDPFRPGFYLAHINAADASKGHILEEFKRLHHSKLPVIAAGDDYNDVEMLEKSDIKIVMENGPAKLHRLADIVAPPADELGIIEGLRRAIWKVSSR